MNIDAELKYTSVNAEEYTEKEYREYLRNSWKSWGISQSRLEAVLPLYAPGFQITPEIQAQRKERRARSEQMLQKWTDVLTNQMYREGYNDLSTNDGHGTLSREMYALLDASGTPEAEAKNQQILPILQGSDSAAKTKLVLDRLEEARRLLDESRSMTDAQVVEHFAELYRASKVAAEIQNYLGNKDLTFNAEQREHLKQFEQRYMTASMSLTARMELMANPLYEVLDPHRLAQMDLTGSLQTDAEDGKLPEGDYTQLTDYLKNLQQMMRYPTKLKENTVEEYFQKISDDPEKIELYDYMGERSGDGASVMGAALQRGQPMIAVFPNGEVQAFRALEKPDSISLAKVSMEKVVNEGAATTMDTLAKELKKADPWYLWSGSDEFKNVRVTLEHVQENFKRLDEPTTEKQAEDMERQMRELKKAADDYLETKSRPYKNDLERSRVMAATRLQQFASDKLAQIGFLAQAREKHFEQEAQPQLPYDVVANKAHEYFQMKVWGNEKGNEALRLHSDARNALHTSEMLSLTQAEQFTPEEKKRVRHLMAQMTALDVILNDRNTKDGQMEIALNQVGREKFVEGIEASKEFEELTKNLTPKAFGRFIANDGAKEYSSKIIASLAPKAPQAKRSAPVVTNVRKNNGPVKQ